MYSQSFLLAIFRDIFSGNCVFPTETDNVKIGTDKIIEAEHDQFCRRFLCTRVRILAERLAITIKCNHK